MQRHDPTQSDDGKTKARVSMVLITGLTILDDFRPEQARLSPVYIGPTIGWKLGRRAPEPEIKL
jgi:hypothetical protein